MPRQLQKPRVGVREAVAVTTLFIAAKAFLSYQIPLYDYGATAAWTIPLIHLIIAIAGLVPLLWLLNRHPGKNIIQIGEELLGPHINAILSAFFVVTLVLLTAVVLRQFGERVVSGFLPQTPISMGILLFVGAATIIAFLGFDAIARTALIVGIGVAAGFLLLLAMSAPFWQWDAVYPLLGKGPLSFIKGAVLTSGNVAEIFIIGLLVSFLPRNTAGKVGYWSVGLAGLILFASTVSVLLAFPYPITSELNIPTLELARIINIGRFLQRMEVVFAPIWVLSAFVQISLGIYLITSISAYALRMPYFRPFILPAAVVVTAVAFIPASVVDALTWDIEVVRRYTFFAAGVPLVGLYGLSYLRTRKGGGQSAVKENRR